MATGGGLALPEPLQDEDSHSWFKQFKVCAAANGWDDTKKLLKGHVWAIYDSLGKDNTDTCNHALLRHLSPDTEENC